MSERGIPRREAGDRPDGIEVDGVAFKRVGVLVWARPAYSSGNGDAPVFECQRCGALVARAPLHAAAHTRSARAGRDVAAAAARPRRASS